MREAHFNSCTFPGRSSCENVPTPEIYKHRTFTKRMHSVHTAEHTTAWNPGMIIESSSWLLQNYLRSSFTILRWGFMRLINMYRISNWLDSLLNLSLIRFPVRLGSLDLQIDWSSYARFGADICLSWSYIPTSIKIGTRRHIHFWKYHTWSHGTLSDMSETSASFSFLLLVLLLTFPIYF